MAKVKKVKALELIKDWALWPRYEANDLDMTNIRRLKDAIEAGETLPPIIADVKSKRIVDGFHRISAFLSLFGEEAEVDVEFRHYENDMDMFLEAARLNTVHGLPLSPKDKVHVILTARRKRVPIKLIGQMLGLSEEKIKQLESRRSATTEDGEKIPLSAGAMDLAGKRLTKIEEKYARTANGVLPIINARLLINALRASSYPGTQNEIDVLLELKNEIEAFLLRREAA